jgi:hypothetical protein
LAAGDAPAKPAPTAGPAVSAATPAPAPSVSADAIAKIYADREFTEIPLDGMRKTIAARLTEAKQTIPHFYLRRDIKIDNLLSFVGNSTNSLRHVVSNCRSMISSSRPVPLLCKLCLRQMQFGRVIVFYNSPPLMWPLPSRLRVAYSPQF